MSPSRLVAAGVVALTIAGSAPAVAKADTVYAVLVDGRPVDREQNSGLMHRGHAFVNVVKVTRAFAGVLTFHDRDRSTLVTIGSHSVLFTVGSTAATVDAVATTLPAAPFLSNGDTFVPIETFAQIAGSSFRTDARATTITFATATAAVATPSPAGAPAPVPAST